MIQRILNSRNFVAGPLAATIGTELYFKLHFPEEMSFAKRWLSGYRSCTKGFSTPTTCFCSPLTLPTRFHYQGCRSVALLSTRESVQANCHRILTRVTGMISFWLSARFTTTVSRYPRKPSLADDPGAGTLHKHGNRWGDRYQQDELLQVPSCRADSRLPHERQRQEHRRTDSGSQRRLLPPSPRNPGSRREGGDDIEIALGSECRYNPPHNDLDAHALAYDIASGSRVALLPAVGSVLLIHQRAQLEDEFLKNNLSGYVDYARDVPAMLISARRAIRSPYVSNTL